MSDPGRRLTAEDVRHVLELTREFERSGVDYLSLELGELRLVLSKSPLPLPDGSNPGHTALPQPAPGQAQPSVLAPAPVTRAEPASPHAPVEAPIVGRFYSRPEPGAEPYVTLGSRVDEDTTVGLIEVMKVFNAVKAGTRGTVCEICVEDASFVEYGQVLFRIAADG